MNQQTNSSTYFIKPYVPLLGVLSFVAIDHLFESFILIKYKNNL